MTGRFCIFQCTLLTGKSRDGLITIHFSLIGAPPPRLVGPGPRIYIPEEQGGPVIPPTIEFTFRRSYRGDVKTLLHTGNCMNGNDKLNVV
jgi:hypothetical protein